MLPTTQGKCQHRQFSDEPGCQQKAWRDACLSLFELAREELEAATSELIKLSLALPGAGSEVTRAATQHRADGETMQAAGSLSSA